MKTSRIRCGGMIAVSLLASLAVPLASAAQSEQPERCVQLSRIESTEVLSNQQIAFKMLGGSYYVNALPHPCPGLRRDTPIMYRTSIDMLCDVDVVTVLETMGTGYMPGASCGLGKFMPMDKGEVEALREQGRRN